ncbi:hypothetical protein N5C37_15855 [Pseudomonas mosselii]|uniref:hypothetical protein n=1 Tax=Pseudomonas mosselii TaxID=78327 RepID=UPI0021A6337C|nr:hypothetical protein [Pseudomonas mosselii]MDH1102594.1 hypothetical protein [Pseudomonas mosselii]MEA3237586.1 hypothetical protein [Pseudomonas mosselii]UWS68705.1 hypothetical protein N0U38_07940 [Pseudomonas mosselii]
MLITANGLGWQAVHQQQRNGNEHSAAQPSAFQLVSPSGKASAQQNSQGSTSQQHTEESRKEAFSKLMVMLQPPDAAKHQQSSVSKQEASGALQEFRDYMSKSPAQKIQEKLLAELGLTKEEYDALPPDRKMMINQQIAQRVQEEAEMKVQAKLEQQAQSAQAASQPHGSLSSADARDIEKRYSTQL